MEKILNTQLFGLITILVFYNISLYIQKKTQKPIFNNLLISIILIILFLKIINIPYEKFKTGADIINFMLGPVTVVLAVPLYRQFDLLKKHFKEILVGILGGVESITVVCIIITGIFGNIFAEQLLKIGRVKHPVAKGIAIGTSAHALGTSKALEIGEVEGAMSSLSIGISGVMTVIIVPILINFIG